MNPERWKRIKELLLQALDLPERERDEFLKRETGDDVGLMGEVVRLIQAEESPDEFLAPPVDDGVPLPIRELKEDYSGKELGEYRLVREIGRGGMGVVYEAEQITLGRRVAVKILPPFVGRSDVLVERFRREAKAASRLEHPNIVPVLGYGVHEGMYYYAMAYVEGKSLKELLDELRDGSATSPLSDLKDRARIVEVTARALHYSHQQGVIHRDIKPHNVLLDGEGQPRVLDFGLAKDAELAEITRTGETPGTPHYMSPEQAQTKRHPIDHRTDVYSLGVVMYELLTLQRPFDGSSSHEIFYKITHTFPQPPRRVNGDVPTTLATICMKALRRKPADRYATAEAMAEDLASFLAGRPIDAKPPTIVEKVGERLLDRRTLLRALPAGIVVGAGGGWWVQRSRSRARERSRLPLVRVALRSGAREASVSIVRHGPALGDPDVRVELGNTSGGAFEERIEPGRARVVITDAGGATAEIVRRFEPGVEYELDARPRKPEDIGSEMVHVQGGAHEIVLDHDPSAVVYRATARIAPFHIDRRPVTNGEYAAFLAQSDVPPPRIWSKLRSDDGTFPRADWAELPVTGMLIEEARAYAEWVGKRLPTRLEWEWAVSGGAGSTWLDELRSSGLDGVFNLGKDQFLPFGAASQSSYGAYIVHIEPALQERAGGYGPHGLHHPVGNACEWLDSPYFRAIDGAWTWIEESDTIASSCWHVDPDLAGRNPFATAAAGGAAMWSADTGFRCAKSV